MAEIHFCTFDQMWYQKIRCGAGYSAKMEGHACEAIVAYVFFILISISMGFFIGAMIDTYQKMVVHQELSIRKKIIHLLMTMLSVLVFSFILKIYAEYLFNSNYWLSGLLLCSSILIFIFSNLVKRYRETVFWASSVLAIGVWVSNHI